MTVGLTSAEAAARLVAVGPNRLVTAPHWRRVKGAIALLADPMAIMLVVAGGLDLALGNTIDAIVLFVALVPVLGVDVVLEARSERALARLRAVAVVVAASVPIVLAIPALAHALRVAPIDAFDVGLAVAAAFATIAWRVRAVGPITPARACAAH